MLFFQYCNKNVNLDMFYHVMNTCDVQKTGAEEGVDDREAGDGWIVDGYWLTCDNGALRPE